MHSFGVGGFVPGLLAMSVPHHAAAQVVQPAGREGHSRVAVHVDETFRRADGSVQARLFEVPDVPRRGVRYTLIAADFDCSKRERSLLIREEFSSMRDPVRQVFRPALVTTAVESEAVSQQLLVVCGEARRAASAPMTLTDMLDGQRWAD